MTLYKIYRISLTISVEELYEWDDSIVILLGGVMKFLNLLSFAIFVLTVVVLNTPNSYASNYPSDYCRQQVFTLTEGPVQFSRVKSACLDQLVIGYKNSGYLTSWDVKKINAVITGGCNSSQNLKVTTLELGKEWNGTGYLNTLSYYDLPSECYSDPTARLAFAFSDDKGNWDSRYGQNYTVVLNDLFKKGEATGSTSIDAVIGNDSWNIIISKMRQ